MDSSSTKAIGKDIKYVREASSFSDALCVRRPSQIRLVGSVPVSRSSDWSARMNATNLLVWE